MFKPMIFPLDQPSGAGIWIMAAVDDPLLQPEPAEHEAWSIEIPTDHAAWIPFHLIKESFGVGAHEL